MTVEHQPEFNTVALHQQCVEYETPDGFVTMQLSGAGLMSDADLQSGFALVWDTAFKQSSDREEELAVIGKTRSRPQLQTRYLQVHQHHI